MEVWASILTLTFGTRRRTELSVLQVGAAHGQPPHRNPLKIVGAYFC